MKLSTKIRYGARALADMAEKGPGVSVAVKDIAERQGVSANYLVHILGQLKAAGVVKAVRGARGGFVIARPLDSVTLKEVYEALEGPVEPVSCTIHDNTCPMRPVCPTYDTWVEVKEAVDEVLERTTLQDLVDRKREKLDSSAPAYDI